MNGIFFFFFNVRLLNINSSMTASVDSHALEKSGTTKTKGGHFVGGLAENTLTYYIIS